MQRYVTRLGNKFVVDTYAVAVMQITETPDWHYRWPLWRERVGTLLAAWAWDALEFA